MSGNFVGSYVPKDFAGGSAVHIGGGEPLLRPEELGAVLDAARRCGVSIDYVETSSSWFKDPESAGVLLSGLRPKGLHTLLVSISPFHNEHIPFARTQGVMDAARRSGMRIFPWVADFIADLSALDGTRCGRTLCEDCYMDSLSPTRVCDPWAVYSATNFEKQIGGSATLTPIQSEILSIVRETQGIERSELLQKLGGRLDMKQLEREFAVMRHLEKVRGEKAGGRILTWIQIQFGVPTEFRAILSCFNPSPSNLAS